MPIASATAERSFSLQRCLKNYARSTMKNDRLSSLGLVHIHRDFEVDLYKAMEMFVSDKTRRADFWTILSNSCLSVIKIVLDSMLYEILVKNKIPDPLPLSRIMTCILLSLSYAPEHDFHIR
jgi:hypothetical protein